MGMAKEQWNRVDSPEIGIGLCVYNFTYGRVEEKKDCSVYLIGETGSFYWEK